MRVSACFTPFMPLRRRTLIAVCALLPGLAPGMVFAASGWNTSTAVAGCTVAA